MRIVSATLLLALLLPMARAQEGDAATAQLPKGTPVSFRIASFDRVDALVKEWVPMLKALGLGRHVAICGDFNTVPWSGPFRHLASRSGMTDLYGDGAWSGYSWPTWTSVLRVPLDNCLVSGGVAVTGHRHGPDIGSDHFPLVVDLALAR